MIAATEHRHISVFLKHAILWGLAAFFTVCCVGVNFLNEYNKYINSKAESDKFTHLSKDMLSQYDPYVFNKTYLAVAESEGFSIDLPGVSTSPFNETVLEGRYIIEYYFGNRIQAQYSMTVDDVMSVDDQTGEDDTIVSNPSDARKMVIRVPDEAVKAGYDTIKFIPVSGSIFSLSYFNELRNFDENVVLGEPVALQLTKAYPENKTGSPYDVSGMFAYLADWNPGNINLQLESTTSKLDIRLITVENSKGEILAKFPESSILKRTNRENADMNIYTSYSLPLITDQYVASDVYIRYRYEGSSVTKIQKANPFRQIDEEVYNSTLIRTRNNITEFSNLCIENGRVFFQDDYVVLDKALFIPEGLSFVIKEGQTVDLCNNAFIISRSALRVEGTADSPVHITSSDESLHSGILILQAEKRSVCNYMVCDNLGELANGVYHLTGAVTFYESDVDFTNCSFLNNRSEDGLNTVRSDINVSNCIFKNTYQDAYDSDFCTGVFKGCHFEATGNDALDVSTSKFSIIDTTFFNIHDKAVSVGEASNVTIKGMRAQEVQIGIGAKDSSVVDACDVTVKNAFIGFCSYQKKPEFGPCQITVNGYSLEGAIDFDYLIEAPDTLIVNGKQWVAAKKKKQALIIEKLISEEPIR